jgi:hypothetical protein
MKKSRPGHLVKVVVKPGDAERVARLLAEETGTLGVRETGVRHRFVADRRVETATLLEDGERHAVGVKVATDADGTAVDVSAEYDDAAAVAAETGLATREVARRAEGAAREGGALADRLVHVVEADRWAEVGDGEPYAPSSIEEDGFVHASTPAWVASVAQTYYPDADEPLLLVLDRTALDPEIRYEEQPLGAFPHVYGPVNADAVVDVLPFPREDGRFVLPEELDE